MSSLNLNINSWSNSELEKLLGIKNPYTNPEVSEKTKTLKSEIKQNSDLGETEQLQVINFLNQVTQKLTNTKTSNLTNQNTVIESGNNFLINSLSQNVKSELQAGNQYPTKSTVELMGRTNFQTLSPGTLNPVNRRTTEETINIDSRFRNNYYNTRSTNMTIQLPFRVKNVVTMHLTSVSIPISYHYISEELQNNTFVIDVISGSGDTTDSNIFTIPDGRYEPAMSQAQGVGLIDEIITILLEWKANADSPEVTPMRQLWDAITYYVDPKSGRSSFRLDGHNMTMILKFNVNNDGSTDTTTPLQLKLGWMLGYRSATYKISGETLAVNAIVSEGLCHIKGPDYMYLSIDDYNNNVNNYFKSAFTSSILGNNIISRVNSTASIGFSDQRHGIYQIGNTDLFTSAMGNQRNYFGPVDIERLHVELLDEYGRHINLNNMDWSLTIGLETIYKN
jgi:hypothetical protein